MSKFTRQCLRAPRVQSFCGFINLQTGTELISLALAFNKVTGVYGLLAILTGYQLSLLQFSTYVYSITVLGLLVYLVPHIRRQNPLECLALAWLYNIDTIVNGAYTAAFGMNWYMARTMSSTASSGQSGGAQGLEGIRQESAQNANEVMPQDTATSMVLIIGLTLLRVYFALVVMAYARQTLQQYTSRHEITDHDGPFALSRVGGGGRKGKLGRLMLSIGRGYWLEPSDAWSMKSTEHGSGEV